jgi:hypothetical protein
MPSLSKKALSLFLRNGCERQFILSLYKDSERKVHNLPPRQENRAGLGLVARAGYEWQDEKVSELKDVFGTVNVHVNPLSTGQRPQKLDLLTTLPGVAAHQFIVEGAYNADTAIFRRAVGLTQVTDNFGEPVNISDTQPDIIQILPPLSSQATQPTQIEPNPYLFGMQPDGEISALEPNDSRLRLRVIDVKLTSEPGAHYFAEVVYYSMTLAAWLVEHDLNDRFVVIAAPAVWPGSHDASNLAKQFTEWNKKAYQPTAADLSTALEKDIEIAPCDVFAPRLRRFLNEQLPSMLKTPWQDLSWHVDYRCKGCEFLGYPWRDADGNVLNEPSQCMPTAEAINHLSRVVGLSRGASEQLRNHNVKDVLALAATSASSPIFDEHQGLRSKRTTFPHRASALQSNTASVIPSSGGDALMPRWPNLHIYIFLDYELSSAITASIGLRAFWMEPLPYSSTLQPTRLQWTQKQGEDEVFLIDSRSLDRERAEFLRFLQQLRRIFGEINQQDATDTQAGRRDSKTQNSTYQIYLWDESQRKHLIRLVGRHLSHILADGQLRDLAWLFPPPELLQLAEDASQRSPVTLVSTVVDNTIAVPIPHHCRLLDIVQTYRPPDTAAPHVHPLYEEPMSDLIPAERIHEWWQRSNRWQEKQDLVRETTRKKASALSLVVSRLENDLKTVLSRQAAPPVVRIPNTVGRVAPHGRLWYEYARLNAAIARLEIQTIRSMPPHEREARLKSARLTRRLSGQEEKDVLATLNKLFSLALLPGPGLFIYEMRSGSREVNAKPGDFLYALSPENTHGFLDESTYKYTKGTSLAQQIYSPTISSGGLTNVSIEAIDRTDGFIALRAGAHCRISDLEQQTSLDFSRNVILDPVEADYLTDKIKLTVQGIGNPPIATADQRTLEALGMALNTPAGTSASSPAAEVLWEAPRLHTETTNRILTTIQGDLQGYFAGINAQLDPSQWRAWTEALNQRLSLIWGPPGTGKSRTLRAIVLGAVLDALANKRSLRLLVTAYTYTAVDNVLLQLEGDLKTLLPAKPYALYRLQSKWQAAEPALAVKYPTLTNLVLNTAQPSDEVKALRDSLTTVNSGAIIVLGSLPQQLHNLSVAGKGSKKPRPRDTICSWFDLIVLDEASQMDVASSTLVFTKLAQSGSCVLAGDDLQLSPIQQADPPVDLEHMVGSVYNYFRHFHHIVPSSLDVNYRSNHVITEFTKLAGYSSTLQSYSPDLRLNLRSPIPTEMPLDWPGDLHWCPEWTKFLSPDYPATCFIYDDNLSSQINDFEADTVTALTWLLQKCLASQLLNERLLGGLMQDPANTPFTPKEFWDKAVGIVTPHRAQMAKIIYRLQQTFPQHPAESIRGAVDTVERFQGQQRDIIIASFGLGDPDIIRAEDEFLYNLNRFNVLTSRARAKLIVLVTRTLLEHLSDDNGVLIESRLLKRFAESYCIDPQPIQTGYFRNNTLILRKGVLRRR